MSSITHSAFTHTLGLVYLHKIVFVKSHDDLLLPILFHIIFYCMKVLLVRYKTKS